MKHFLSIFILFLIIISCDPCDDCTSVTFEPTVQLMFINQDSIDRIDERLSFFSFNDSALAVHIDALDTLKSRLEEVQAGLDTGNTALQTEKDEILSLIAEQQADSLFYEEQNINADSATVLTEAKSTINSGLLQLDKIEIFGTSTVFTYEDSASIWSVPLSYDAEFNQYEIQIAGVTDILEFDYETFQEVDEKRNVLIRAKNIEVISFTQNAIDSVLTNCEETCQDGEATFTIYF